MEIENNGGGRGQNKGNGKLSMGRKSYLWMVRFWLVFNTGPPHNNPSCVCNCSEAMSPVSLCLSQPKEKAGRTSVSNQKTKVRGTTYFNIVPRASLLSGLLGKNENSYIYLIQHVQSPQWLINYYQIQKQTNHTGDRGTLLSFLTQRTPVAGASSLSMTHSQTHPYLEGMQWLILIIFYWYFIFFYTCRCFAACVSVNHLCA